MNLKVNREVHFDNRKEVQVRVNIGVRQRIFLSKEVEVDLQTLSQIVATASVLQFCFFQFFSPDSSFNPPPLL